MPLSSRCYLPGAFVVLALAGCSTGKERLDPVDPITQPSVPGWLEVQDLSLHSDVEAVQPKGAHVRGRIGADGAFTPTSAKISSFVESGSPQGSPGWIELRDLSFHRDQEARAPMEPYIKVVRDEAGRYLPTSADVIGVR